MTSRVFIPSPAQRAIVEAPPQARLVVDAGPGTGKTATAAARVLALLRGGMLPGRLCMVSFARAAVLEMRQRLIAFGADEASLPRVTTLDSLAWHLRAAEPDGDDMVLEGHDAAIAETLDLLREDGGALARRLSLLDHVLLDETQDFVGARALLVIEIVRRLRPDCGVTLLTDEAQAIYGFAGAPVSGAMEGDTVAAHFLNAEPGLYRLHALTEIHRTDETRLLALFESARREVTRQRARPDATLAAVRRRIARHGRGLFRPRRMDHPAGDTLILYRTRAEVLHTATLMAERGEAFRLRPSGLPPMLHPWIARVLGGYGAGTLSHGGFLDLWRARMGEGGDPELAWSALVQATGDREKIPMARLSAMLRASQPPPSLCRFDPGDPAGPVLGTIHASKGREMPEVRLMLPPPRARCDDPETEARVLFVGATRARASLRIGRGPALPSHRLPSGRVYLHDAKGLACEIGRPRDFDWPADPCPESFDLPHGERLALVFAEGRLDLRHGDLRLGTGAHDLMADIADLQRRFAPHLDYRPYAIICGPVFLLGWRSVAPDDRSAVGNRLLRVPAVTGLVRLEFRSL